MAKIVVVDDEPAILRVCGHTLRKAGHIVVTFEDGRKAIQHLQSEPADLLITDIFMPEMEGLETVKRAQLLNPRMPIVAMSGGGAAQLMEYLAFARRFGAVATLDKPFLPAQLIELVGKLLEPSRTDGNRAE